MFFVNNLFLLKCFNCYPDRIEDFLKTKPVLINLFYNLNNILCNSCFDDLDLFCKENNIVFCFVQYNLKFFMELRIFVPVNLVKGRLCL